MRHPLRAILAALLLMPASELRAKAFQATPPWWNTAWTRREPITVAAGANAPQGGYTGYTARIGNLDTAALVGGALMLASGNDLRIVRWDGAVWTDLPRHVLSMNTASTDVRWMLAADIPASTSDTSYYLYYGNPLAGAPAAVTTTNVYLWWDDATANRLASYTQGRLDDSGPGPTLTSPGSIAHSAASSVYTFDTTNDHSESLRRTGLLERDVLAVYDFNQTAAYTNDMCSGPLARVTTTGTPDVETASGFYMYLLGDSNSSSLGALMPYAAHGDIAQSAVNQAGPNVVDGTAAQVTIGAWHSAGVAAWGAGPTNLKGWYQAAPSAVSLGLFGVAATVTGSQASSDTTAAGTAGVFLCQEVGQIRNILIRRYTEPEPAPSRGAAQIVPAVGGGGGGGGGGQDGGDQCGCGTVLDISAPAVFLAAVLAMAVFVLRRA